MIKQIAIITTIMLVLTYNIGLMSWMIIVNNDVRNNTRARELGGRYTADMAAQEKHLSDREHDIIEDNFHLTRERLSVLERICRQKTMTE